MTTEFLKELFQENRENCTAINQADPIKISWPDAIRWTNQFRKEYGDSQKIGSDTIKGYSISKDSFDELVNQGQNLKGIKIYIGLDENKVFRVIIVATEGDNGDDYNVPSEGVNLSSIALPKIGEVRPCPDWCGKDNILNKG